MNKVNQIIVEEAVKWIDFEEIQGNKGFKDAEFQERLEIVGWEYGQAWCVYFTEMVWKWGYAQINSLYVNILDKLFNAGAMATLRNFKKSDVFTVSKEPQVGSVIIWQHYKNGKPTWMGHAGILVDFNISSMITVEGNTSKEGSREGLIVGKNKRNIDFNVKNNGLVLKGFIYPILV